MHPLLFGFYVKFLDENEKYSGGIIDETFGRTYVIDCFFGTSK